LKYFPFLDNLFPESENPSRVFIMIVDSQAYLGSYSKSPFHFARKWTVKARAFESAKSALQVENAYLKSSIEDIKSQMSVLVELMQKKKASDNNEENEIDSDDESLKAKKARKQKDSSKQITTRAKSNNLA